MTSVFGPWANHIYCFGLYMTINCVSLHVGQYRDMKILQDRYVKLCSKGVQVMNINHIPNERIFIPAPKAPDHT